MERGSARLLAVWQLSAAWRWSRSDEGGLQGDAVGGLQVRWDNGNVRFYYVGGTPWRKDPNGNDTENPRAIRCLLLVQT